MTRQQVGCYNIYTMLTKRAMDKLMPNAYAGQVHVCMMNIHTMSWCRWLCFCMLQEA